MLKHGNADDAHHGRRIGTIAPPLGVSHAERELDLVRDGIGRLPLVLELGLVARLRLGLFLILQDATIEAHDAVCNQHGRIHLVIGEGIVDVIVLGTQRDVRTLTGIKARLHDLGPPFAAALLQDHHLDAVDRVCDRVTVANDRGARLRELNEVRAVGILAVSVIRQLKTVVIALFAVVGIVHAAQRRDDLIQRVVRPLHLVHIFGGHLPALRDRIEGKDGKERNDGQDRDSRHDLNEREALLETRAHSSGFLQNVT